MSAAERVAFAIAEKLGGLDAAAMARHPAFVRAVAAALKVLDEDDLVAQVVALGGLAGARNPHAVIVARLRELPAIAADRRRIAEDVAEVARWAAVDWAAKRGVTLRALVDRGDIFEDEARSMLASEFTDDGLRGIAAAALAGGSS